MAADDSPGRGDGGERLADGGAGHGDDMAADKLLRIYLQDHHAAAAAGVARARSLAAAESSTPDGRALDRVATEIAEDRASLERIMAALGIGANRAKELGAKLGERVGLLKRNGSVVRRSPLTSVVELEAMTMAVRGKRAGWTSLLAANRSGRVGDADIDVDIDIDALIARADAQLATLAEIHDRRAAEVFAPTA